MPHWPLPRWHRSKNLGLVNISKLLNLMDNPHIKLPPIIHVAGTNGKGSTVAFLKAMFNAANYAVHTYTSPHLINFNERIVIANQQIADQYLFNILEKIRLVVEDNQLDITFFEVITVAAFIAFADNKADLIILEVGLGGRLDATNVIEQVIASIITPISLDHTLYLGETIEKIAAEKAAIIKPDSLCISSLQSLEAEQVIISQADQLNSRIFAYEYDYIIKKNKNNFNFLSSLIDIELPFPALVGDHQLINAASAIATIINLPKFNISSEAIKEGLREVSWPARLQQLKQGVLYDLLPNNNWQLWLDGAHNEAGAHVLGEWIKNDPTLPLYLIVGMTKGRDSQKFLSYFVRFTKLLIAIQVESEPLSLTAKEIALAANNLGIANLVADSLSEAVRSIIKESSAGRILICGSLYLASDVIDC